MLNGLSLFSGYGGIDLALSEWIRPIMYCEIEKYPQGILISRMDDESLPFAPIWNDVTTLDGAKLRGVVDFIYGGFPCQDISIAGNGAGLAGKRSGLFYEIARLAEEIEPTFLLLENVPAIRTRGALEVQERLASLGYDSRWLTISAAEIGANHKRERFFCFVAHAKRINLRDEHWWSIGTNWKGEDKPGNNGEKGSMADADGMRESSKQNSRKHSLDWTSDSGEEVAHADMPRLGRQADAGSKENHERIRESDGWSMPSPFDSSWWSVEPDVGRVANGVTFRVDRIKALGNGVVPLQVKTAFEKLMGIK